MKKEENKNLIKRWKEKSLFFKILEVIGIVISILVIVLALMQLLNVWDNAINVFEPLLGVLMIIQAIENWKINRKMSYYLLFVAIFIFIVAIIIIF